MLRLPDFSFLRNRKEVPALDPGRRALVLDPLSGTCPAATTAPASDRVCRAKGICIPKAHIPPPRTLSGYLGPQSFQVKQSQATSRTCAAQLPRVPPPEGGPHLECSCLSLRGGVYIVERDAHISACKREPGMGREADGLRLRTRACLPFVSIFQHRPPRRPRILNSKLSSKITGKQASRCWLTLEDSIMGHFFYVFHGFFASHFMSIKWK